ncbi:HTH-type transcriptional regulator [Niallia circulans]|jgi:LysR family transcriptional regulator, cell division regulator|uniref:LysR family transcriptional regulator n=1 Tax=Niallia TaxID=2837506 RepID=UPI00077CC5FA|nr:LysR family transcriptional regulator [Niallia circulans]MDR4315462.1 LysR family transcriptional regulator [Niallia circulans]MED3837293.1 LysR family transcriptional regulator [Niallia circulans]MED4244364.1 LysR family transcriptional regulator [Niallia circulans]MED4248903.1 LysR family transcriptional regulator [Niallia circulans]QKH61196.1 LysR family transcriptional regulator [Niallia circulans]
MDLQTLKVFQTIAKLGSISQAARELQYAQSNITMKIQQLEAELQTTLFYRHNRGTALTAKGRMLLTYAEKIFHLIEETKSVMNDDQSPKGPLMIGSMETTAAVRLPVLFSKYLKNYPDVDLTLKTGSTKENILGVLNYKLDGAFVAGPIANTELIQKDVFEEELILVTNPVHSPIFTIEDIQDETLLVFRPGCSYRERLEQWFRTEGACPKKMMEFGTLDGIIGCVTAGLGISMLPQSVVAKQITEGTLRQHQIPSSFSKVKTLFIYREDKYLPSSLIKFINMMDDLRES